MLWCLTECCFKSGSVSSSGGSSPQKPTTTPFPEDDKPPCSDELARQKNCRNGGTCFVKIMQNRPQPFCTYWLSVLYIG